MDLNPILIGMVAFHAATSALLAGLRLGARGTPWVVVNVLVLLVLAAALWAAPDRAGWMGLVPWLPCSLLPPLLALRARRAAARGDFQRAASLSRGVTWLHPFAHARGVHAFYRAQARRAAGDAQGARRLLEKLVAQGTGLSRRARLELYRWDGDWEAVIQAVEAELDASELVKDLDMLPLYAVGLGETGRLGKLAHLGQALQGQPTGALVGAELRLFVAAFGGRYDLVDALLRGPLAMYDADTQAYWRATALQAEGDAPAAEALLRTLQHSTLPNVRRGARRRLDHPLPAAHGRGLPAAERALLDRALAEIAKQLDEQLTYGTLAAPRRVPAFATRTLLALNLLFFLASLPGGPEDAANLVDLGAVVVPTWLEGGLWWRAVTAGFLHHGALHLTLNVAGLWIIGRYLEGLGGASLVAASYLVPSILTFAAAGRWLYEATPGEPLILLGASAGVMGLMGSTIGFATVRCLRRRVRILRAQLGVLLWALALQGLFETFLPFIGTRLHVAGLCLGIPLGAWAAWRGRPMPPGQLRVRGAEGAEGTLPPGPDR